MYDLAQPHRHISYLACVYLVLGPNICPRARAGYLVITISIAVTYGARVLSAYWLTSGSRIPYREVTLASPLEHRPGPNSASWSAFAGAYVSCITIAL
jgi:hypothetical protein